MSTCKIDADILYNCQNKPVRGAKDRVIIVPHRNISEISYNETNHLIIENVDLIAGERAYEMVGDGSLLSKNISMLKDEFGVRYLHNVPFKVYGASPPIKKTLESLAEEQEPVMVILQQNYLGTAGNAKYEVYGKDAGLRVTVMTDEEGRNIFNVELANEDGYEEPHLPANFFDTDVATTDAKVEALLETDTP